MKLSGTICLTESKKKDNRKAFKEILVKYQIQYLFHFILIFWYFILIFLYFILILWYFFIFNSRYDIVGWSIYKKIYFSKFERIMSNDEKREIQF